MLDDTHPEVARRQIEMLRAAGFTRRAAIAIALSREVAAMSRRALRMARPDSSEREIDLAFVELHYGRDLAARLRRHLESRA